MQLTRSQEEAIVKVKAWALNVAGSGTINYFYLAGYAGTGKTTILKYILEDLEHLNPLVMTYTAKASQVLMSKGVESATIHSQLYKYDDVADKYQKISKREDYGRFKIFNSSLVIIDEASMVTEDMMKDLSDLGVNILAFGDPGQLPPPVEGKAFFKDKKPDVFLDEVLRQAKESGIIRYSIDIREGRPIDSKSYGTEVKIVNSVQKDVVNKYLNPSRMFLCGRNKTKFIYNNRIRAKQGYEDHLPRVGEKLINLVNTKKAVNGDILTVTQVGTLDCTDSIFMLDASLGGESIKFDVNAALLALAFNEDVEGYKEELSRGRKSMFDFMDYGYCITVHKAQGSQWDSVVVRDESWCFKEHSKNWLYTAVTRAAKELVVIK